MRHLTAVLGIGLLAFCSASELAAQGGDDVVVGDRSVTWLVETAVLAAPANLRDSAEVRGWTVDDRLVTLRQGHNNLICLADRPGDGEFHSACYHAGLESFMERGRELRRDSVTGMERNRIRWQEIETGEIRMPRAGMVYNLSYDSEEIDPDTFDPTAVARLHALYMPGATTASTGVTTEPGDGPWLMFAGSPSAHLMMVLPPNDAGGQDDEGGDDEEGDEGDEDAV